MASKKQNSAKDELRNDPEKLVAVLDKAPPATRKSKPQSQTEKNSDTGKRAIEPAVQQIHQHKKYWKERYRKIPDSQNHFLIS